MSPARSSAFFMYTSALAYFTPIIGGLLSDGLLGKYRTIVWFSALYILGFLLLSIGAYSFSFGFVGLGLFLIGVGTGGIKPCVSSFGADQIVGRKDNNEEELSSSAVRNKSSPSKDKPISSSPPANKPDPLRAYFSYFYFAINVGALTSYIFSPLIKRSFGYGVAFSLPTIFMAIALAILVKSKSLYVMVAPSGGGLTSSPVGQLLLLLSRSIKAKCLQLLNGQTGNNSNGNKMSFLSLGSGPPLPPSALPLAQDFFRVTPFLLIMPIFWTLYDQQGASWVLQASRMKLPKYVEAEQLGVLNTMFVLALIPFNENFVFPFLKRRGLEATPLRRMVVGMLFASFSFILSGFVELSIAKHGENNVSVSWQIPQYFILTIGELGVSTTGLEFFYEEAPTEMRTAAASLFLLTTAVGDLLGGLLYTIKEEAGISEAKLLFFCASLMIIAAGFFARYAMNYTYRKDEIRNHAFKNVSFDDPDFEDGEGVELVSSKGGETFDMSSL